MEIFFEYRPSTDTCHGHVRRAQGLGLIPAVLSLAMMLAVRTGPGPGLWSALGSVLGLQLVLWGASRLPSV
ncbi:MAG TPA: hypothetical protein PK634_14335, partial [Kiritimatiellia bacterium]|nr:hypothetical protein [Kiritimatiellia bacterium]